MYVKQLELTNFKSFGGTTAIPLLPGFTVVSGPNGSGKSNLLDALLFALGLSGSKGMRAERLPDLVNHSQTRRGHSVVETRVVVTFALEPHEIPQATLSTADSPVQPTEPTESPQILEWQVTRKLRVTKQGTYTSTYLLNDQACTLNELHNQLQQLRIYPQGYNVVLQGDVTGIISMNSKQRREIIDELAGVADFDRKINQAREKLDTVKEREERFRIVEQELIQQRDRLQRDRVQAEKYKVLRQELETKQEWSRVLAWQTVQQQIKQLQTQIQVGEKSQAQLQSQLTQLTTQINTDTKNLETLNRQVKALGEDELIKLQTQLAQKQAEQRQLSRQQTELKQTQLHQAEELRNLQINLQTEQTQLETLKKQQKQLEAEQIQPQQKACQIALQELEASRNQAKDLNAAAQAWMQEHTQLRTEINQLATILEPQRLEQSRLQERQSQLERQISEQTQALAEIESELAIVQDEMATAETLLAPEQTEIQRLAQQIAQTQEQLQLNQQTRERLQREQREKQRQLDKLEAQQLAIQETQGTQATRLILQAQLPGVIGTVAQLGRVETAYQLALEIAAGGRLGQIVVEDDAVAAAGIEILKRERGGRATFLPLTKMQSPRNLPNLNLPGLVDYALNLIEFERRLLPIFAYVFGQTLVFEDLSSARRYIGQHRIVTLDGELLETSGAMSGGSRQQSSLHFGKSEAQESNEVRELRHRLAEIDRLLSRLETDLSSQQVKLQQATQDLTEKREQLRDLDQQQNQLKTSAQALTRQQQQIQTQLSQNQTELTATLAKYQQLTTDLPQQEGRLTQLRETLAKLEESQTHNEWQTLQDQVQQKERAWQTLDATLRGLERQKQDLIYHYQRQETQIQQHQARIATLQQQQTQALHQATQFETEISRGLAQVSDLEQQIRGLETQMGEIKQQRDQQEYQLRQAQTQQQTTQWQLQNLSETQAQKAAELKTLTEQTPPNLPPELPEIPADLTLPQLQEQILNLEKRLRAMEPVNMRAIEEYEHTQTRLDELSQKLAVLDSERTEVLLRIENFTTLRHQAFQEAFDAVNTNFQAIFATLSDGDGYLQLENAQDPFAGGLNLVAHPKGKPVQRLASMSGGEKSLTALSFIFALQRYRPSPFYAFDEVDMFLDGANVERLSNMIKQQSLTAQFIVVSLRRPMIEASQRTIGVTQARGQHTQVIGIKLQD
ncbi:chromosome segregation protein SMC [Thermosynechococcaceae cyanobacterium BACA0444]|uniref:Chromosome partition protein Smc n=1 Tax=Pseudocalidococcus azoricus BACA0444 TaxID=2918990 RepID=A0AAE4FTV3_9CYAN|nr:chromosome segregation protein SMC [Pseudocalidococcus azoricus]MDS3862160.1 chromosome segregation protein SMC [Pseudocalidococcus azoricus BACA0444]